MHPIGMEALMSGAGYEQQITLISQGPLEYLCSKNLLQGSFAGTRWQYEGVILEHDRELRVITRKEATKGSPRKNALASGHDITALDMLLADLSGPVMVT